MKVEHPAAERAEHHTVMTVFKGDAEDRANLVQLDLSALIGQITRLIKVDLLVIGIIVLLAVAKRRYRNDGTIKGLVSEGVLRISSVTEKGYAGRVDAPKIKVKRIHVRYKCYTCLSDVLVLSASELIKGLGKG